MSYVATAAEEAWSVVFQLALGEPGAAVAAFHELV